MVNVVSELKINRQDGTGVITFSVNGNPVIEFNYADNTQIIISAVITSPVIIDYTNWKLILDDLIEWVNRLRSSFDGSSGLIFLHKEEHEIKSTEISLIMKALNNDILLSITFTPPNEIQINPRIALNISLSDFSYWLNSLMTFRKLLVARGY